MDSETPMRARVQTLLFDKISALREHYEGVPPTREDVAARFLNSDALCAGSFIFYHCGEAWPLHAQTKQELYAFLMCCARLGYSPLGAPFLRRLAELLQWSELARDYTRFGMDIDVFLRGKPDPLFPHFHRGMMWDEGGLYAESEQGFYSIFPNVFDTAKFEADDSALPLQLIFIGGVSTREFVETNFDAAFCKNYFDGKELVLKQVQMIGEIDLAKYQSIYRNILEVHTDEYANMCIFGMHWSELLPLLRESIQHRLEKYERRRFTITNADQVRAFISELDAKMNKRH